MKSKLEEEERQEGKRRFNTLVCTSTYVRIYWRMYALTHQHDGRYSRLHEKKAQKHHVMISLKREGQEGERAAIGDWTQPSIHACSKYNASSPDNGLHALMMHMTRAPYRSFQLYVLCRTQPRWMDATRRSKPGV